MVSRNEVKYIQSLYHKKNRDATGVFIAEGVKIVNEILHSGFKTEKIYAVKEWLVQNNEIENVIEITEAELKSISNLKAPNRVLAIVTKQSIQEIPDLKKKITLVLDGIQDPGNLGTIIRTADWFGVESIIASTDTADVYNAKVIQSTMGSFTRVNIFYVDLKSFLSNNKIFVCGATLNGENINALQSFDECLLVIGNEAKGIREGIYSFIEKKISIPRFGNAKSLNAAVAAGILLWKFKLK